MPLNRQQLIQIAQAEIATSFGAEYSTYAYSIWDDVVRESIQDMIRTRLKEIFLAEMEKSKVLEKIQNDTRIG